MGLVTSLFNVYLSLCKILITQNLRFCDPLLKKVNYIIIPKQARNKIMGTRLSTELVCIEKEERLFLRIVSQWNSPNYTSPHGKNSQSTLRIHLKYDCWGPKSWCHTKILSDRKLTRKRLNKQVLERGDKRKYHINIMAAIFNLPISFLGPCIYWSLTLCLLPAIQGWRERAQPDYILCYTGLLSSTSIFQYSSAQESYMAHWGL